MKRKPDSLLFLPPKEEKRAPGEHHMTDMWKGTEWKEGGVGLPKIKPAA